MQCFKKINMASLSQLLMVGLMFWTQALADKVAAKDQFVTAKAEHWWAFRPLSVNPPPEMNQAGQISLHPIDRWVFSHLHEKGLQPNPQADHRVLLRRASFDLQGIPPSYESVQGFMDDASPAKWSNIVSGLLESERYGERWGRYWLDLARYAESSGFEHDYDRPSAYHYRDFVIKSLNADMPYDQFVRWQLAGDEYEPNNPLAMMATGFLGAGVFPTQITANEVERVRYDAMDDMLSTAGSAMLGLTVGCARCHDHKADPISSMEYYRLLSTFTSTVRSEIEIDLEPEKYQEALQQFEKEHAPYLESLQNYEKRVIPVKFENWLKKDSLDAFHPIWEQIDFQTLHSKAGASFRKLEDGSYIVEGKSGDSDVYTMTTTLSKKGVLALRVEALADSSLKQNGPGRADNGNFGLSRIRVFITRKGETESEEIPLIRPRATFQQNDKNLSVAAALDENPNSGWAVDPQFGDNHAAVFEFNEPLTPFVGGKLELHLEFSVNKRHSIGRPRISLASDRNAGLREITLPSEVATLLRGMKKSSSVKRAIIPEDRHLLMEWWKSTDVGWQTVQGKLQEHLLQKPEPDRTKVLVCAEGFPAVRMHSQGADFFEKTYFLKRGSTNSKGKVVNQGFIKALHPDGDSGNPWKHDPPEGVKYSGKRRALAEWMTDVENGAGRLLARVIVNRLWQHHFGTGLVSTPNDFGGFGNQPAHPELLDWLAVKLIENQWRLKPMHQLIMTSTTYQQTSHRPTRNSSVEEQAGFDHAPFFPAHRRLEAEAIRDSLLTVSGRLDKSMFGQGSLDPASLRRSIYLTVKRSRLITAMQSFDAPEPLVSQGTRPTTTVAPQALLLMNSPFVRNWAKAFAERIRNEAGDSMMHSVDKAYEIALNRKPGRLELAEGAAFIAAQTERHRSSGSKNYEMLALTDFAQVVMNLNEFIYVE